MKRPKKYISYFLLLLGFVVLFFFMSSLDLESIVENVGQMDISMFTFSILLLILNILVKGYRWKLIIKHLTGTDITMNLASVSIIAGVAAGSIIPGRGDVAKPLMVKSIYDVSLTKSIAGMFIERILDVVALFFLFFLSAPLFLKQSSIDYGFLVWLGFFLFVISIPVLFSEKLYSLIEGMLNVMPLKKITKDKTIDVFSSFLRGFSVLRNKIGLKFFILSIFAMLLEAARLFYVFRAMHIEITPLLSIFSFTASILIGLLTLIPGGMGATEISLTEIVKGYLLIPESLIKSAVLLDRVLSYYSLVLLGSVILILYKKMYNVKEVDEK